MTVGAELVVVVLVAFVVLVLVLDLDDVLMLVVLLVLLVLELVVLLDLDNVLVLDLDVVEFVGVVFQSQLPDWHTAEAQKAAPLPQTPLKLQQLPHLPRH